MGRNAWTSRDHTWKQKNQKNKTEKSMSFLLVWEKIRPKSTILFLLRSLQARMLLYIYILFFHVRKKVAWKSSTSYGIVVNLFNYSKLTQELQNKKEKHIEELNKSYEREKEKYHLIVNWMTLLHKKNCLTYTRIKKWWKKRRNNKKLLNHRIPLKIVFEIVSKICLWNYPRMTLWNILILSDLKCYRSVTSSSKHHLWSAKEKE